MALKIALLDRKLLRDVWRLRSQLAAIMLVMAVGVTVFVMFLGMIASLDATRAAFYDRSRFADVFANAKRAPEHVAVPLRQMPGVATVETRISAAGILTVRGFDEPVTVAVNSVPDHGYPELNNLDLRKGRWVDARRADEVLVSEPFAQAHNLTPGDHLLATLNGRQQKLTVVGIVLSPEYIYSVAPGRLIPDDKRFGILWMARRQLEAAFDMDGAFNSLTLRLRRDAVEEDVIDAVDRALDPYGGRGAFARADQVSDRFLQNELDQLRTMVRIIPPVFLLVAAFLLNIVISRLVATEREIIGLLKAFGYTKWQVAGHYAKLVALVIACALVIGFAAGTWLGRGLTEVYTIHFRFPFLYFRAGWQPYLVAGGVALLAGGIGTISATRAAIRLEPAEAMRPPAPLDYSASFAARMLRWRFIDEATRMVLRHLIRHPQRSALVVLGIAMAMGLLTGARGNINSLDKMLFMTFEYSQRQDVGVTFVEPRAQNVVYELARLPGVQLVEPVRNVGAVLHAGHITKRQGVSAVRPADDLNRLVDKQGRIVQVPRQGVLIAASLANTLGIGAGDPLVIEVTEGRRPTLTVTVAGVVDAYVGTPVYADLDWFNDLLDEGRTITGANLAVDAAHMTELFRDLKDMPAVAGVEMAEAAYQTFTDTMDETIGIMITINTLFSSLIIFGVVYNAARISLSERGRELASMRVLGFSKAEVSFVLLGELAVVVLLALPLGAGLGALLSYTVTKSFSQDLFVMPFALQLETIAMAALITIVAAVASGLLVRRRIDQFDLISVLKTRE